MIIGIDASRLLEKQKTGVEWYTYYLLKELQKIVPEEVLVKLYTPELIPGVFQKLPKNWEQVVLKWPPRRLWTQIRLSFEMWKNPPDVLFIPSHVMPLVHPKKTVMTIHDIAAWRFPEAYSTFQKWYSLWATRYAVKRLWKIIVPTSFVKKEIEEYIGEFGLKNIDVVHHGYDHILYHSISKKSEEKQQCLKKLGLHENQFILSVGRIEIKKNTLRLLKAYELFRKNNPKQKQKLVLVGKAGIGSEIFFKALDTSKYKNDVIVTDWLDNDDLPYLYNAAGVFIFPSLYEGFGLPVLEALACKTQVICSKDITFEELVGESVFYIDPLDCSNIAKVLKEVLVQEKRHDEELLKESANKVKKYTWENCAKETYLVLKN